MNNKTILSRVLSLLMVIALTLSVAAIPSNVNAASKKQAEGKKIKCKIALQNVDSNTVIEKGKKLKIRYSATSSNGKKVKVRFKSSDKKIASVTKKGVIKAKKNGKVKITVTGYVKGKKRGSKTVRIRVGIPVSEINLSGYKYLRAGTSTNLKASVSPDNATRKTLVWTSSNPRAVNVDENGKITGIGNGSAVITASAIDGSGVYGSVTAYSHRYTKNDTHWIAHRGLHETVTENSAEAFELAGKAGFWGCECDIWETKHIQKAVQADSNTDEPVSPDQDNEAIQQDADNDAMSAEDEALTDDTQEDEDLTNVNPVDGDLADGNQTGENLNDEVLPDGILSGSAMPANDDESPDGNDAPETVTKDEFDIIINHDPTYKRVFGVNAKVEDLTVDDIRSNSKLSKVCFFDTYLNTCKTYKMIPVIEIKDYDMSDEGIALAVEKVYNAGLLSNAQFISFDAGVLERFRDYIKNNYSITPYTGYLMGPGNNVLAGIELAHEKGFTGVNCSYQILSKESNKKCGDYGLKICAWTYNTSINMAEILHRHIVSKEFNIYSTTIDGKPF